MVLPKRKQPLESDIEMAFVKYAHSQGCLCYKLAIVSQRGFPDRTCLLPDGRVLFFEFKRGTSGKVSAIQESIAESLTKLGHKVFFILASGEAEAILCNYLHL